MTLLEYISEALEAEVWQAEDFAAWQDKGPPYRESTFRYFGERVGIAVKDAYEAYDEYQALLVNQR